MTTLNMLPAEASGGNVEAQKDFNRAEPILNGSFGVYTGKETVDNSSVPLLSHVEPSMKEQYFRAIRAAHTAFALIGTHAYLHPSMKCVRPFVFFLSVFNVFILL